MTSFRDSLSATTALTAEDARAAAIRVLLALADADPTLSGATLILPDGSVTYLNAATLLRGGRA